MSQAFPPLQNDRLLRAAKGLPVDRIPVWVMRQAGRYLPEYLAFTKDKDFFGVCRNPEFAVEVTLQPIRRFDLDAAIIFSDILVIPQALGVEVLMIPKSGPSIPQPLKTVEDLVAMLTKNNLTLDSEITFEVGDRVVKDSLQYVYDAITLGRHKLEGKVPLLGFAGSPWTLLCYMVEGGSSRLFSVAKKWVYGTPKECQVLLQVLAKCVAAFLVRQIDAGASAVQVFDSHAGELTPEAYEVFSKPYLIQIAQDIKARRPDTPLILFCKGTVCPDLGRPDLYDVLSVDSHHVLHNVRSTTQHKCTLQGNFETGILNAPKETIRSQTHKMMQSLCNADKQTDGDVPLRYIANLGHGITPDIDPAALGAFIDAVHDFKRV